MCGRVLVWVAGLASVYLMESWMLRCTSPFSGGLSCLSYMKSAYKRGCTATGNSHFLTLLRLLDKDAQTKWQPQTTDRRYSPLSHSVKVSSHEQGLQILPKPTNALKPMRHLCNSSLLASCRSLCTPPSHTLAESVKRQVHVFFAL